MRWHVEAADTKTGLETAFTVEALTEAEAERLAHYNGLLVSAVRKAGVRPAGVKPPPVVPYAKPAPADEVPEYPHLIRRARATRALGVALAVVGWAALAAGVGTFAYVALRAGWSDWTDWRAWLAPAAAGSWRVAVGGLAALAAGSALRLLAAMALVLRVAARGTYRPRPPRDSAAAGGGASTPCPRAAEAGGRVGTCAGPA